MVRVTASRNPLNVTCYFSTPGNGQVDQNTEKLHLKHAIIKVRSAMFIFVCFVDNKIRVKGSKLIDYQALKEQFTLVSFAIVVFLLFCYYNVVCLL